MYLANAEYLSYIDTSIVRTACSKVVIDGIEYSGRIHLKIYPKISHVNSSMIGGFSAATCEFEIYNVDGSLNLNGKEIEVYRGLEINGAASWIPMGIFSATDDNITNNKTARSITFKGLDRASRFDVAFEQGEDITFPCTFLDFVQKLCARRGVALESTAFPMAELTIETAPNIPSNYTERQLISCAAELGGCIARINRSGNLEISKPYSTGRRIFRSRYSAVSKEPVFGPINSVVLGREGYSDDIVYPAAAPDNLCEWRIEDNPFVENRREELIEEIAANIIGMSFIPFKLTDCVEDYIFDINDSVEVECKDGTVFTATVLSKTTSSRIRSELKAETQKSASTNRKIAGSVKDAVKRVQLDVDHQNNRINALVEDSVSRMELELLSDSITARFEDIETPDTVENVKNAVTSITKDGVNIENGALTLTDDNGNVLIGVNTDENGDMYVSGNIRANSLEAETVTSESIKSGAITADKLSIGRAKSKNLFKNGEFTERAEWKVSGGYFDETYETEKNWGFGRIFIASNNCRLYQDGITLVNGCCYEVALQLNQDLAQKNESSKILFTVYDGDNEVLNYIFVKETALAAKASPGETVIKLDFTFKMETVKSASIGIRFVNFQENSSSSKSSFNVAWMSLREIAPQDNKSDYYYSVGEWVENSGVSSTSTVELIDFFDTEEESLYSTALWITSDGYLKTLGEVSASNITTGMLKSLDGNTYFDLNNSRIMTQDSAGYSTELYAGGMVCKGNDVDSGGLQPLSISGIDGSAQMLWFSSGLQIGKGSPAENEVYMQFRNNEIVVYKKLVMMAASEGITLTDIKSNTVQLFVESGVLKCSVNGTVKTVSLS